MNVNEIPVLPVEAGITAGLKTERQNAPEYIRKLIDEVHGIEGVNSLKQLGKNDIRALAGGNMSVDYSIRLDGRWVVVKLRTQGAEAEAEVLRAWQSVGADVVEVYNEGVIPGAELNGKPVKFLVMEAATNQEGDLAKTAMDYLEKRPEESRSIAIKMGEDLAMMHRAVAGARFGEFADMWGHTDEDEPISTWNEYLLGFIDTHVDELHKLDFSNSTLEKLKENVKQMSFPHEGVYLHGDYSKRNVLLTSKQPYRVKAFDPNPIIGEPSWDLAIIKNNLEFARLRFDHERENEEYKKCYGEETEIWEGLMQGYHQAGGRQMPSSEIDVAMLMQCMYLLPGKIRRADEEGRDPENDLEVRVVRETLIGKMKELAD